MKTIGLLGGMTWRASATYYERVNQQVSAALGPYRSASVVMHSVDGGSMRQAMDDADWKRVGRELGRAARSLQRAGADNLVLCSNTMHRLLPRIQSQSSLPVLHIADALADRAVADGHRVVALFGTAFTMTQPFYRDHLERRGLQVLVPDDVGGIDAIVLGNLARGVLCAEDRAVFVRQMQTLAQRGAQAMVLGCTEIGHLISDGDVSLPVLDTTLIHADAAVAWALSDVAKSP